MSILPTQSISLYVGDEFGGIEPIFRVGVEPADEVFWVYMLELRTGQRRLCNTLLRWYPWLDDLAFGVTGNIMGGNVVRK